MIYKNAELYNVQELIEMDNGDGYLMSRFPKDIRDKINTDTQSIALHGCGCEIRFIHKGDSAKITLRRAESDITPQPIDILEVYHGSFQSHYKLTPQFISNKNTEIVIPAPYNIEQLEFLAKEHSFPFDPKVTRVILPYGWQNVLVDIEGDIVQPEKGQTPQIKYLAYGSSITYGGSAVSSMGGYARRTAQTLGVDLINLGCAGSARLEDAMANYIAKRQDWDFATIEMGINVFDTWSVEEFSNRVDRFVSEIAENNPHKWIFCIDMFTFNADINNNEKANAFRKVVKDKVESMKLPKLVYISGRDLLCSIDGLSTDLVHPSLKGMEEIAMKLSQTIKNNMDFRR